MLRPVSVFTIICLFLVSCQEPEHDPDPGIAGSVLPSKSEIPPTTYLEPLTPERKAECEAPAGHRWVFCRENRIYHCNAHDHYFRLAGDAWVASARPGSFALVEPVDVTYNGPRPFLYMNVHLRGKKTLKLEVCDHPSGHRWVYYPMSDVYHCTLHGHYIRRMGGRWVASSVPGIPLKGPRVTVEYNGPRPYYHVDIHETR